MDKKLDNMAMNARQHGKEKLNRMAFEHSLEQFSTKPVSRIDLEKPIREEINRIRQKFLEKA